MLFDDAYQTISAKSEAVFSDRGSKFIGMALPLTSETARKDVLAGIRSAHPKARHFCWAMRLSPDRSVYRINDDGEPAGAAGRPMLNVLLSREITDVLLVVVRYFGGTLLGIPGLIHAYKKASELALDQAIITEKFIRDTYQLNYEYADMNDVMRVVKEEELSVLRQDFAAICRLDVALRKSKTERILSRLAKIPSLTFEYKADAHDRRI